MQLVGFVKYLKFIELCVSKYINIDCQLKASDPKWINPNDIQYGVNPLRLGGL